MALKRSKDFPASDDTILTWQQFKYTFSNGHFQPFCSCYLQLRPGRSLYEYTHRVWQSCSR